MSLKETIEQSTINLKAPIVWNTTNNKAKQVILNNDEYEIRHLISTESVRGDGMLVLSRKVGETIWIGEDVEIVITEIKGDQMKLGIKAPRNIEVIRGELRNEVSQSNVEAVVQNLDTI